MITFVINCPGYLREEDLIEKLAQKVINQEGYFVVNNNLYYSSKSSVFRVENELSENNRILEEISREIDLLREERNSFIY